MSTRGKSWSGESRAALRPKIPTLASVPSRKNLGPKEPLPSKVRAARGVPCAPFPVGKGKRLGL